MSLQEIIDGDLNKAETNIILLMHKDIEVCQLYCTSYNGRLRITKYSVLEYKRLPKPQNENENLKHDLQDWLDYRATPDHLRSYGNLTRAEILRLGLGLSLSDCYWLKPVGADIEWKDVNYFSNVFANNTGLFISSQINHGFCESSFRIGPNGTVHGMMAKRWTLKNNKRYLIKYSNGIYDTSAISEMLSSRLAKILGLKINVYRYLESDNKRFDQACITECFCSEKRELIQVYNLIDLLKINLDNPIRSIHNYLRENLESSLSKFYDMIIIWFITGNRDCHLGNYGFIRDTDSLGLIDIATAYDNGYSLCWDKSVSEILHEINLDHSWNKNKFLFNALKEVPKEYFKSLSLFDSNNEIDMLFKDVSERFGLVYKEKLFKLRVFVKERIKRLRYELRD